MSEIKKNTVNPANPFDELDGNPIEQLKAEATGTKTLNETPSEGTPSVTDDNAIQSNVDFGIDGEMQKVINNEVLKSQEARKNFSKAAKVKKINVMLINPRDKVASNETAFPAKDIDKTIASFKEKFGVKDVDVTDPNFTFPNKADDVTDSEVMDFYKKLLEMKENPMANGVGIHFITEEAFAAKYPTVKGVVYVDDKGVETDVKINDLGELILNKAFGYINVDIASDAQFQIHQASSAKELVNPALSSDKKKKLLKKKSYVVRIQGKKEALDFKNGILVSVASVDKEHKLENASGRFRSDISVPYKKLQDGTWRKFHFRIPLDVPEFKVAYAPGYEVKMLGGRDIPAISIDDEGSVESALETLVTILQGEYKRGDSSITKTFNKAKRDAAEAKLEATKSLMEEDPEL